MVIGPDASGPARRSEFPEVHALLKAAFGRDDEARLVKRLRASGEMWAEQVTHWNGVIGGYAALSRMRAPVGWACLGPVAVLPRMQNAAAAPREDLRRHFHIGTRLVHLISRIPETATGMPTTIVVVGEPRFYQRAGFSLARARKLVSPFPLDHTLIVRPGNDIPEETLVYPSAFDGLA